MRADASGGRGTLDLALRSLLAGLWFALVFFAALPAAVLTLTGVPLRPPPGALTVAGLGLFGAALALVATQMVAFVVEGRGTPAPLLPPRRLVARGLYRRVRNPMYLLYTVAVVGEALAWRSWPLLAYALAIWLLAHLYVVCVEEKQLERRFGEAYRSYCEDAGRWLPRARRPGRGAPGSSRSPHLPGRLQP